MKIRLATISLIMILSGPAPAQETASDENHTANYCSQKDPGLCAHLFFAQPATTQTEGEFLVHFVTSPEQLIQNPKIDLWMDMGGHGHGSAPVEITSLGSNKFKIQNAWFVMAGLWQVRIQFEADQEVHQIQIPVQVNN